MYLTIDAGNTRTKCHLFTAEGQIMSSSTMGEDDFNAVKAFVDSHQPQHGIISTTGHRSWNLSELHLPGMSIELSHETPLHIEVVYTTPDTLGRDRIAAACGAQALYPGQTCLVISTGTCVTSDILIGSGIYVGGNIAPGLRMRLRAMHEYTARLPLAEPAWPELPFGDSTIHALQNGAALGIVMEIDGLYRRAKDAYGEVTCLMTGGDAPFLAERMESRIFVEPDLVAHGLFQILALNVKKTY